MIQSSFSQHLIYSFLRGRPVVVCGADAKSVRAIVRLLSIFVVGNVVVIIIFLSKNLESECIITLRYIIATVLKFNVFLY